MLRFLDLIADQGVRNDTDDDERENDYHDTNDGIGNYLSGLFCSFFVAGGSDITEAADDQEQYRYQTGYCQRDIYDI